MLRATVARELAWRPEWPLWVAVVVAWIVLLADATAAATNRAHNGHVGESGLSAGLGAWTAMSLAMMGPTIVPAARQLALNSLRVRRWRAVGLFVGAYLLAWAAVGVVVLLVSAALANASTLSPGLALLVAAGWQLTPIKRRALLAGHGAMVPMGFGWRADTGSVRLGLRQAGYGVASCGPLMAFMALVGHGLSWMALLTTLVFVEHLPLIGGRTAAPIAAFLAAAAAFVAARAIASV